MKDVVSYNIGSPLRPTVVVLINSLNPKEAGFLSFENLIKEMMDGKTSPPGIRNGFGMLFMFQERSLLCSHMRLPPHFLYCHDG